MNAISSSLWKIPANANSTARLATCTGSSSTNRISALHTGHGPAYEARVLHSLRLADFRCFKSLDITVPDAGTLLVGENAQGKTSVLEAVCVLVRLQSPRSRKMQVLGRVDSAGFGIAGNPWNSDRKVQQLPSGLKLEANHTLCPTRSAYLEDGGLIVWMGNEDMQLIRGSGEIRRRYLDFIGSQINPAYRRAWSRYRRALQAKNLLLKESHTRETEIRAYEEILIENGNILTQARQSMVQKLSPLADRAQQAISGTQEALLLQYIPASGNDLRESIRQARERERRTKQCVVGPHRDDIQIRLLGRPAADFASEGQQRTSALALKLAQGELLSQIGGKTPIYLIDDIFGELDPKRRNALMQCLPAACQKWITTTHLDWMNETDGLQSLARYQVKQAECRRL
ncbi:MAG: DNA replication/repair protein RecF [Luteolibacter sp.]